MKSLYAEAYLPADTARSNLHSKRVMLNPLPAKASAQLYYISGADASLFGLGLFLLLYRLEDFVYPFGYAAAALVDELVALDYRAEVEANPDLGFYFAGGHALALTPFAIDYKAPVYFGIALVFRRGQRDRRGGGRSCEEQYKK